MKMNTKKRHFPIVIALITTLVFTSVSFSLAEESKAAAPSAVALSTSDSSQGVLKLLRTKTTSTRNRL
jgi:hypothetical protein